MWCKTYRKKLPLPRRTSANAIVLKDTAQICRNVACECIKFRTVAYDSTPYDSDARPITSIVMIPKAVAAQLAAERRAVPAQAGRDLGHAQLRLHKPEQRPALIKPKVTVSATRQARLQTSEH